MVEEDRFWRPRSIRYVEGGCSIFQTTTNPETNSETKKVLHFGRGRTPRAASQDIGDAAQIPHSRRIERPIRQRRNHSQASLLPAPVGTLCGGQSLRRRTLLRRRPSPSTKRPTQIPEPLQGRSFPQSDEEPLKNYNDINYIEVSKEDIPQATENSPPSYWESPLMTSRAPARNHLQLLLEMDRKTFTRTEVMNYTGWTKTRLHIHLTELIEMELVLPESTKKNQFQTYKLLYNGEGQDGRRFLLGLRT